MKNKNEESDNEFIIWQISRKLYSLGFLIENLGEESTPLTDSEPVYEGLGMIITELAEQASNVARHLSSANEKDK